MKQWKDQKLDSRQCVLYAYEYGEGSQFEGEFMYAMRCGYDDSNFEEMTCRVDFGGDDGSLVRDFPCRCSIRTVESIATIVSVSKSSCQALWTPTNDGRSLLEGLLSYLRRPQGMNTGIDCY